MNGLRVFTMSHTGSHNFAVVLKDSGGIMLHYLPMRLVHILAKI